MFFHSPYKKISRNIKFGDVADQKKGFLFQSSAVGIFTAFIYSGIILAKYPGQPLSCKNKFCSIFCRRLKNLFANWLTEKSENTLLFSGGSNKYGPLILPDCPTSY